MWTRLDGQGPLYLQLYRALRRSILDRDLPPGARLPASRALAGDLGLSRNVVLLAYEQLLAEGYVHGRVGSGTFVAPSLPDLSPATAALSRPPAGAQPRLSGFGRQAVELWRPYARDLAAPRPRYDFRYGVVAIDSRALAQWRRLAARQAARPVPGYGSPQGLAALREAIADYARRQRGCVCAPERIVVVNGSQQALDLIARLLVAPGDRVLVEEPGYRGARHAWLAAGAELVPAAVDGEGMALESAGPAAHGARLAYVTPSHQFPTGAVLSLPRRLALLDWARVNDAFVVEDDYDSEFRYQGRPVEAVQGLDRDGRTVYVGTFSKVLFPALRLGYLILPDALVEPFAAAKWLADRHAPLLEQGVLAAFIAEGHFERHLRRMRTLYGARREALLAALDARFGQSVEVAGTRAGIHLLAWLRDLPRARLAALARAALAQDVGVYPVNPLYLDPPPRAGLLLGYAALEPEAIREGVERLAGAVEGLL